MHSETVSLRWMTQFGFHFLVRDGDSFKKIVWMYPDGNRVSWKEMGLVFYPPLQGKGDTVEQAIQDVLVNRDIWLETQ